MMSGLTKSKAVVVKIVSVSSQTIPPGILLEYEVFNGSDTHIWMVDDDWFIWRQTGKHIELSFARGKMRSSVEVFGYFLPSVVKIDPDDKISKVIKLTWPQPLNKIWNEKSIIAPAAGDYTLSVRVGYGFTPGPDESRIEIDVETPVLCWQREAVSQTVQFKVEIEGGKKGE